MAKIFVNYRRDDTKADAREINRILRKRFGGRNVFFDIRTLAKGEDFRAAIDLAATRCDVMVVVIGRQWLTLEDAATGQKRLFSKEDWTRYEIERALFHNKAILPVLIDGAPMPSALDLPEAIRPLAYKNAADARHQTFEKDIEEIAQRLRGMIPRARVSPWWVGAAASVALAGGIGAGVALDRAGHLGERPGMLSLRQQLADANDRAEAANQNLAAAKDGATKVQRDLEAAQRATLQAKAVVTETRAMLDGAKKRAEALADDKAKLEARITRAEQFADASRQAAGVAVNELNKANARAKEAEALVKSLSAEKQSLGASAFDVTRLEKAKKDAAAEIDVLKSKIAGLEFSARVVAAERDRLEGDLKKRTQTGLWVCNRLEGPADIAKTEKLCGALKKWFDEAL